MAAASASPNTLDLSRRGNRVANCDAKTRRGTKCAKNAGWGTDHLGFGQCKLHGGASPNGIKHAANQAARHLAVEVDMEPHDALLWCVRVAAGEVTYFTRRIAELEEHELMIEETRVREWMGTGANSNGQGLETISSNSAKLHIWVEARAQALERLAKYSKLALDAGVEERRVRLAETLSAELSDLFAAVFAELKLTPEQLQLARPVVHRHLVALEGGVAA